MLFNRFEFLYNFARPDQIIEVDFGSNVQSYSCFSLYNIHQA